MTSKIRWGMFAAALFAAVFVYAFFINWR